MEMGMLPTCEIAPLPLTPVTSRMQRSDTVLSDTATLHDSNTVIAVPPRITYAPSLSDDDCQSGPQQLHEKASRRMTWIMQMAMDTLLPTLLPEQRKLLEGTTDLQRLIVPLFRSWEEFRSTENRANKTRNVAKSTYEKFKNHFSSSEVFEVFWKRKLAAECDEKSWGHFETVVRGTLEQVAVIDRVVNSVNNV
jgi:hypothetical protein